LITPKKADKFGFHFAVAIAVITACMSIFILPFSDSFLVSAPNAGVLLVFAVFSLYPIGVLVAGWSSNNKYSLLGGFRSAAQLISYEVPMMLSILGVLILMNWGLPADQRTFSFLAIAKFQNDNMWLIFLLPIGFAVAFTSMLGETERVPFDLPEAESELVMGWRTEYAGSTFLLIMAVEYFHMFVNSGILVYLFFGGWYMPFAIFDGAIWFLIKLHIFVIIMIWIRAALPRVRIDQFLTLGWTRLIPMAVINLFLAIGIGYYLNLNGGFSFENGLIVAIINIVLIVLVFVLVGLFSKRKETVSMIDTTGGSS
jgi:NADH-quinone oxidoreductase subunit H